MTNPYQQHQHSSSSFAAGDALASGGLPPLHTLRQPSYASVLSGNTSPITRPDRSGISHILNPSPDAEQQAPAGNPHAAAQNHRFEPSMPYTHLGAAGEDISALNQAMNGSAIWPPRLGSSFPHFSRSFDPYMRKETLPHADHAGLEDVRIPSATPVPNISDTGFLSPSYLRGSNYLQKLEEKHRARLLAERDGNAPPKGAPPTAISSRPPSNGTSSHLPVVGTKVSGAAHRGVAYDVVEKPMSPAEDDDTLSPLPSRWNRDDKEDALEVLADGYEVRHTGRTSGDHEASAVRADHYMSPACGVYYFEITVLNTRVDKVKTPPIAIGFASKEASISRAPGWETDSWGYHGDDGNSFASQNVGKPYAEMFGVGDTVGCLVNFRLNHALFTKNGRELGIAFKDIPFKDVKGKLYPVVGLKKKEDHIMTNFGQRPFMFDIDGYMKRQMSMIEDEIRLADTSRLVPGLSETNLIQQLVLQFLQHDGYVETARAFAEELHTEQLALRLDPREHVRDVSVRDDEDARNRQRIRRAVLEGDMDRAMAHTDACYPAVLRENEHVYFRLRCRKFIEMIRREAELNTLLEEERGAAGKKQQQQRGEGESGDEEMLEVEAGAAATTTTSMGNGNGNENGNGFAGEEDMDLTMAEDINANLNPNSNGNGNGNGTIPSGGGAADAGLTKLSQEALEYGMELRAEFSTDPRRETAKQLDEIFSLIAYPNPMKVKEVRHLVDGSGRVAVAEELNSAILMSLGKSSRAALESVYAQTCVLLEDLRQDGGDGAFVTVDSVVAGIPPARVR